MPQIILYKWKIIFSGSLHITPTPCMVYSKEKFVEMVVTEISAKYLPYYILLSIVILTFVASLQGVLEALPTARDILVTGPSVMVMLLTSCSVVACMVSILLIISFRSIPTLGCSCDKEAGVWCVDCLRLQTFFQSLIIPAWCLLTAVRCQLCFAVL